MRSDEKLMLRAIRGAARDRHPVWLMRQAGRYLPEYRALRAKAGGFLDLCLTPDFAVEATLQPIRRYGFDAAILFSDILILPYGFGQPLSFQEGEGPRLDPVADSVALARLPERPDLARLEPVYEAVRQLRRALPPETALIGFAGAPWTVATYMIEGGGSRTFARARAWMTEDRVGFGALIDRLVAGTIEHLSAQIEAGAEIVQIFDSWAGALEGESFERWVVAPTKVIVSALKARFPAVPIIGFPRASGSNYLAYVESTGVDLVSLDPEVPLTWARDQLQPRVGLQGNLDPQTLVTGGPALLQRVDEILATLGSGRFVFNLGHGIVPQTPPDHVAALVERVRATPVRPRP